MAVVTHQGHSDHTPQEWNALMEALLKIIENPAESHSRRARAQDIYDSIVRNGKNLRPDDTRGSERVWKLTEDSFYEDII